MTTFELGCTHFYKLQSAKSEGASSIIHCRYVSMTFVVVFPKSQAHIWNIDQLNLKHIAQCLPYRAII